MENESKKIKLPINLGMRVSKILQEKHNIPTRTNNFGILDFSFTEEELRNIDGDPDELSLFSCIVLANIYWKSDCKMLCVKNMHFGIDNGNNEKVENIKPFVSYFS